MSLQGRVALITGASRGIGQAIALALARQGVHVALLARHADGLRDTAAACERLGVKTKVLAHDLTAISGLPDIVRTTVAALGSIDYLVNNAGAYAGGAVAEANLTEWDQILDTNVRAVVHLTRHALGQIAKSAHGAVINIASVSSKVSHAGGAIYCASKHALLGFSNSLFEDVREQNIKVCAICPGYVNTEMASGKVISDKAIQPEDVADAVVYVLRSPQTVCPTEIVLRPQRSPMPG